MNSSVREFDSLSSVAKLLFELPPGKAYAGECIATMRVDAGQKLLGIVCFSQQAVMPYVCCINDAQATPRFTRSFSFSTACEGLLFAHMLWFPFDDSFQSFSVHNGDGRSMPIIHYGAVFSRLERTQVFSPQPPPRNPWWVYVLSILCRISGFPWLLRLWGRARYAGCWLFADRGFMADDNAEHMYRWVMRNHPEQKIFFALHRKSPDWPRLEKEGFRLVHIAGLEYLAAYFNCVWLIASQRTDYIAKHYWRRWHANIARHRFCFLQHGISMNYMPRLNTPHADLMVCAARPEYEAFAADSRFPYVYTKREVRLTGFPRHDELIHKATANPDPRTILIMPSWRSTMSVGQSRDGQFLFAGGFENTEFFRNWQAVLRSEVMLRTIHEHGYQVHFYPHPHLRPQLHHFQLEGVTVIPQAGVSIQDILADTALLITDYSSIAMETALLRRPVLYFQFDQESFFNTNHQQGRGRGYFEYTRDGFGEVVTQEQELYPLVEEYVRGGCRMKEKYKERADAFFPFNDQNSCRRVYEALRAVDTQESKK